MITEAKNTKNHSASVSEPITYNIDINCRLLLCDICDEKKKYTFIRAFERNNLQILSHYWFTKLR